MILFQLMDDEKVRGVISMNEDYELFMFSNSAEVNNYMDNYIFYLLICKQQGRKVLYCTS